MGYPCNFSRMNSLILLFFLEYFSRILASNSVGPEIIELLSDNEEPHSISGNSLALGLSGSIEPHALSSTFFDSQDSQRNKRKVEEAKLVDLYDDEVQVFTESKEDNQYSSLSISAKRSLVPVVEKMDVRALAVIIPLLSLNEIRGHLIALGEEAKTPIKDNCGWNLLHEAVHTDYCEFAQILMVEFGFDPNAFDPLFGSAVYLVQSKRMAELLKSARANLNDQRPCYLYNSAVDSARSRRKMALVSMVESFATRSTQLQTALSRAQTTLATTRFAAKRADMFKTALSIISRRRTTSCASLEVLFLDEEGKDAGGLSVEFINLIKEVIITRGAVIGRAAESGFYQLRPDPVVVTKEDASRESQDLNEIKLLGYIVGLSIFHKVPLNIEFNPIMYQIMCGLNPNGDIDMMAVLFDTDPTCYNSFRRMGDIPESDIGDYAFPDFKGDEIRSWKSERGILKSKKDILRYIPLAAKERVYTPFENSLAHFKAGLDSAISTNLIYNYITPEELKTVLIGENDYKAAEWRAACAPPIHSDKFNEQYEWFWRAVDEISVEQRAILLKFVTALVSLPIGGFKALDYQPTVLFIDEPKKVDRLPCSSTCFNQIRLYPITSYAKMKEVLILAAEHGSTGFGDR